MAEYFFVLPACVRLSAMTTPTKYGGEVCILCARETAVARICSYMMVESCDNRTAVSDSGRCVCVPVWGGVTGLCVNRDWPRPSWFCVTGH